MSLHRLRGIVIVFAVLAVTVGTREWSLQPDGTLHIRFLNVGQGDSALITTSSGKNIIIDGGPDWSLLEELGRCMPFFRRHIDLIVLSHPNLDHIVGLPEVLKRYSVGAVVTTGVDNALPRYRELLEQAPFSDAQLITVSAGHTIDAGDGVTLEILWPPAAMPEGFTKNVNDTSIVLRMRYKNHAALFTGDIEKATEETLVRSGIDLAAEVLKVGHHGSATSSTERFLRAVQPRIAVISVGRNSYGHPREDVLQRLRALGAKIRRTDEDGTVDIVW